MIHYAQSAVTRNDGKSKWIRFDKTNAIEAKMFLGTNGWFYNREDLYLSDERPMTCTAQLIAIDDESDKPFALMSNGPVMVWCKYFVIRQY